MTPSRTGPSVTASRNEAAELLLDWFNGNLHVAFPQPNKWLDAALSEERRLTVERIKAKLNRDLPYDEVDRGDLLVILDETGSGRDGGMGSGPLLDVATVPLDVERLAEAIRNVYIAPSASRDLDAQNIAREYARLGEGSATPEDDE